MPSTSLEQWQAIRAASLDEIEAAHASLGGTAPGRRYATQQVNNAYAVLLSGQFQGFCRDLHTECADAVARSVDPASPALIAIRFRAELTRERRLDKGNPSPGNIGTDFDRFGLAFWTAVKAQDKRNAKRLKDLETLCAWRNGIAHQDFSDPRLNGRTLQLVTVKRWRKGCAGLAFSFDAVMQSFLQTELSRAPW